MGGAEVKVSINPSSDFRSKVGPANAIVFSVLEKTSATLVDYRKDVFVDDTVGIMGLTQRTPVTSSR